MKKKIAIMLLTAMTVSLVACGKQDDTNTNDNVNTESKVEESTELGSEAESEISSESENEVEGEVGTDADGTELASGALDIINSVWATYADEEKFSAGGGDSANLNFEGPGAFDATNTEELDVTLGFPADQADKIDDAASIMHMMNANTFTGGVFHVTDAENVQTVADALKENIMNRQWMCGFPEKLIIVSVDNYVVSAFGNGELIENFKTKLSAVYENATLLYEESL